MQNYLQVEIRKYINKIKYTKTHKCRYVQDMFIHKWSFMHN